MPHDRTGKSVSSECLDVAEASSWAVSEGLYTSPHLVAVRERIRINGAPLSEETFTKYFYEVWDRLKENSKVSGPVLKA